MQLPEGVATVPLPTTWSVSVGPVVVPPPKLATTVVGPSIETSHVRRLPRRPPLQPWNVAPAAGVSIRVTVLPEDGVTLHVLLPLPQSIPPPLTTPFPVTVTVSGKVVPPPPPPVNVALMVAATVAVNVQVAPWPAQGPLQPANVDPGSGVAVSVTGLPEGTFAEHAPPSQLIAPAAPVTLPLPVTITVSGTLGPPVNVAVTLFAADIVKVHVELSPLHAPLQPAKVAPVTGRALSVTDVSALISALQALPPPPQLISLFPVPPMTLPAPTTATVSGKTWSNVAFTLRSVSIWTVQVGLLPEQSVLHPVKT